MNDMEGRPSNELLLGELERMTSDLNELQKIKESAVQQKTAHRVTKRSLNKLESEQRKLEEALRRAKEERRKVELRRHRIKAKRSEALGAARACHRRLLLLDDRRDQLQIEREAYLQRDSTVAEQLKMLSQVNALNDSHFVWYAGNYGTINHIPLRISGKEQDRWDAVNSALGNAMALLDLVCQGLQYELQGWELHPKGNFSFLRQKRMPHAVLDLWTDGSILSSWLYPKQRLNEALVAFISCIKEVQEHLSEMDPALQWPYPIEDHEINGVTVHLTAETKRSMKWTLAMKYMLISLKWVASAASRKGGRNGFFFLPVPPVKQLL